MPSVTQELTDYILYKAPHRNIWRANPTDPFIYISYDREQLVRTYGTQPVVKYLIKDTEISQLSSLSIDTYRELVDKEFVGAAGFPLKELDASASVEEIKAKNVIFVVNVLLTYERAMKGEDQFYTVSQRVPENFMDEKTPAVYKFDWVVRNATSTMDSWLASAQDYARDVVTSCPATFPKGNLNYWSGTSGIHSAQNVNYSSVRSLPLPPAQYNLTISP